MTRAGYRRLRRARLLFLLLRRLLRLLRLLRFLSIIMASSSACPLPRNGFRDVTP